jgi:hypothetical protein
MSLTALTRSSREPAPHRITSAELEEAEMTTTLQPNRLPAVAATIRSFEATYAKQSPAWLQRSTLVPERARVGVDELLSSMHRLAARLDGFRSELQRQSEARSRLRDCVRQLARRVGEGCDRRDEERSRETLIARRRQLRSIEQLEDIFDRGVAALGQAVAALGMPSAQFSTFAALKSECEDGRIDVRDEIRRMDAVIVALDRDYAAREERLAKLWDTPRCEY